MQDWQKMTAAELGRGIEAGRIDPVELTDHFLSAIDAHEFSPRIYARLTPERARAEALAARERAVIGLRRSPLDGVPISWKDLFDTAGVVTEAGTNLLKRRTPDRDAVVLRNATMAGTVCLGKTHLSELAFSGLGLNPSTASPPCVNNHDAVAGGSSSGAATSVAFGLAPAAIGSDTGGSVRLPAAWNDLVGLKTTSGLLSLDGAVPLINEFDTVGPLTRSVEDAALLTAIMGNRAAPDLCGASLKGRRFAVLTTIAMDDLAPEPAAAFASALDRLRDAGAEISEIDHPAVSDSMAQSLVLYSGTAYGIWRDAIKANPDAMFHQIRTRFQKGADFTADDLSAAWQVVYRARASWAQAVAGVDAVLLPASPILPPDHDRLLSDHAYYEQANLMALRNTRIGNLLGGCSLTLPTGTPSCGLMMMAPPLAESALLRLGAAAERALA
ncbi:amidase [Arenibacterium halophilum]|uniref:Amidase n=1 Tax=Arenibacterium halophilum TaxID=2583821 RepID=A0ABY2X4X5_9RHOB|nr:amidase [Arenibacterium halophilum]TMV10505.1 amidase [Arenibacterium halophilum]